MATVHIFLNDDEVRQAVCQYLADKGVVVAVEDIHFIEGSSGEQISVEAEAMNVELPDGFKGL